MRSPEQFSRVLLELIPNKPFYWSLQDGVKLTPPFILLNIIGDRIEGHGEHQSTVQTEDLTGDTNYKVTVAENRLVTVRVSFFGLFTDTSYSDCRYLSALFRSFKGRSALYRGGFSIANMSDISRVTVSTETTPCINNYFDITLRYKSINEFDLDPMEEVEVTHHLTVETDLENPDEVFTVSGTNTYTR